MASYTYEPLPQDGQKRYCGAPRHGKTNVTATFLEKYEAEELGVPYTESFSCDDCHDSMLQAFMDEMLSEATDEEKEAANAGLDMPK